MAAVRALGALLGFCLCSDCSGILDVPASVPIHGVNLGSWLVPEKWITPALFKDSGNATDLYMLSDNLGKRNMTLRMDAHRDAWIVEDDFAWLAAHGVNAVRLPLGYWDVVDDTYYDLRQDAYPTGGSKYVQRALDWGESHGIKVLLDIHAAPGGQNGEDHSGRAKHIEFYRAPNVEYSLMVVEELVKRWGKHPALFGIELLNEPAVWHAYRCVQRHVQRRVQRHVPHHRKALVEAVLSSTGTSAPMRHACRWRCRCVPVDRMLCRSLIVVVVMVVGVVVVVVMMMMLMMIMMMMTTRMMMMLMMVAVVMMMSPPPPLTTTTAAAAAAATTTTTTTTITMMMLMMMVMVMMMPCLQIELLL